LLLLQRFNKLLSIRNKEIVTVRQEFIELKKYLVEKRVSTGAYAIGTLPKFEGYCIYDAKTHFEVFYFERGLKFQQKTFIDVEDAVAYFKAELVLDPFSKR